MFKSLNDGWNMSANKSPFEGVGIHDTFHVDALGNLNGLHTTVETMGANKIHLNAQPRTFERQTTLNEFIK